MKRIILLFINISMMYALSAQTIYHYKQVAEVNPNTGEKKAYYGKSEEHLIIQPDMVFICKNANGDVQDDDKQKNETKTTFENMAGSIYQTNIVSGYRYRLPYLKTENGMIIYYSKYINQIETKSVIRYNNPYVSMPPMGSSSATIIETYVYVSPDKSKLNKYYYYKINNSYISAPKIYVYELYDSDPKGSMKSQAYDPAHPTQIY